MPKLCRRIIALAVASCLVAASFPSVLAADEYTAQHTPTVWEYLIDGVDSTARQLFNSVVGAFVGTDYCGFTDSGKHEGTEVVSKRLGSDGDYIFFIRCTGCGNTFAYKGSDAQQQYNDALHSNNLDNGLAVTPEGGLIWRSTPADIVSEFYPFFDVIQYRSDNSTLGGSSLGLSPSNFYATSPNVSCSSSSLNSNSFVLSVSYTYSNGGYIELARFRSLSSVYVPVSGSYDYIPGSFSFSPGGNSTASRTLSSSVSKGRFVINLSSISLSFDPLRVDSGSTASFSCTLPSFRVTPSTSLSTPSVPTTININNTTYNVTDIDLETRTVHTTENYTIEYGDTEIKIYDGPTEIKVIQYVIENPSDPDPGPGGDTSDPDPGPGGDTSGGSGCCEQCALLLRQANQYLLQIQTLVDQINDKLGDDGDNYTQGIYNLLVEINNALDNLPTSPHTDYESKLTTICNQLANIWGDLENIKDSLGVIATNTNLTNNKLDTVHSDLEAVLAVLQEQKGILQQILDTLKKILGHVATIDENVEELKDEESSNNFFSNFIMKFHFFGDIFSIIRQLFADITNDAATVQMVDDGTLPIGDLSSQHFPVSGSPVAIGTAPEVLTRFPDDKYHGVDLSSYSALDLSWYARYKSRVDALLSGFLWIGYIWLLFKRAPGIVRGAAMVDETNIKIDDFRNGG